MIDVLNKDNYECPLTFDELHFQSGLDEKGELIPGDRAIAFACLQCGHVQSNNDVGNIARNGSCYKNCSLGQPIVKLILCIEPALWVDCDPPTHAFIPCGHFTSKKTAK